MALLRAARPLADAVLATVVYADLFDFPLDRDEIGRDLIGVAAAPGEVGRALDALLAAGELRRAGEFIVLPGRAGLAALRRDRRARAARLWPRARRWGRALGALPFVRMVAVSGSLAVGNPDPRADLDYLLVTAPGRLWLVRAFAVAAVRLARPAGARLCPNYLLTTRALALDHRDLYTAHELLQAVPVAGAATYRRFRAGNAWAARWLPNRWRDAPAAPPESRLAGLGRWAGERALGGTPGDRLEAWEGGRKRARFGGQGDGAARFTGDLCEGHFGHHRREILRAYLERCAALGIAPPLVECVRRDLGGDTGHTWPVAASAGSGGLDTAGLVPAAVGTDECA
ncbi:MAG TPA: hypothetical protein VFL91_24040 [Thermomicrobiales bacterium]|nr:hypothetical protein [Thermomicrobiales bacterium]